MLNTKGLLAVGLVTSALAVASPVGAQPRGVARGRAVPRGAIGARVVRPSVVRVVPYRPYVYRPGISLGFYYGYPYYYGFYPYSYGYPYGYPAYGYPGYVYGGYPSYGYAGGYPSYGYGARAYGGVRIDVAERNAEVYADGYYVGIVEDFNGTFQQLTLEPGPHRIEVRAPDFEPIAFDVNVEPGRTITYRAPLRPQRP